ncbi:kynurenine--oxoglutarate transaminase 1-like [Dorcoceras hygrometricum]|uniref:Kynurenine--oxoglutarate transaminase 1-like n=1 Tax=Dorcoceras hygrometricum TaxID=472368 RepID=A0A2Z7CHB1_9LAMI|nr:kynurenine--oxoglutarate transaminase 1-like [Dorcoceras hygrometricum]
MEEKLSCVAKTLTTSPIQQLSFLAQRCNAINLAEGFPDFPAPLYIKDAAVSAINSDFNQYRHVQGICDYVARNTKEMHGIDVDPDTDIVICCGQSEAFAATMFAIIDQGDEVILFDPSYETYDTCIKLAGGVPVYVALDPPYWTMNPDKLEKILTDKTKALVLNSPHNPTGKVFTKDELDIIAGACRKWDVFVVTDEVYEHITFDNEKHLSIASLPEMQRRTIITSSLSKTFGVTGWRVGWAIAPSSVASAVRNIHIKITDSAPAPFQEAALTALNSLPSYFDSLRSAYQSKRDYMINLLQRVGFEMEFKPQGSFFVFAKLPETCLLSDVEFIEELIRRAEVVAVPGRGFFHAHPSTKYIRFAFCKSEDTLAAASERISRLVDEKGYLTLF